MKPIRKVSRREFLGTGGVLVLGVTLAGCGSGSMDEQLMQVEAPKLDQPWSPDVFLKFLPDGTVEIIAHRVEMGQGIRTGLPAVIADELEADWDRIEVIQGMADQRYGDQNTDGSHSVRDFFQRMRQAGASARTMLEEAAAQQWQVSPAECRAQQHKIVHQPTGRSVDFADVLATAAGFAVPEVESLKFKDPADYRFIGKAVPIVDMHDMTHGTAKFGTDTRLPGMKYAAIARCPVLFGTAKSYSAEAALAVPGVRQVVEIPFAEPPAAFKALGGIAVIADNSWAAMKGRDALEIEWDEGKNAAYDSDSYKEQLLAAVRAPGQEVRSEGNVEAALAGAVRTVEAEYYTPHLAHAPMEPPHAVAHVTDDGVEIWAPTQNPQSVQGEAAALLELPPEQVRVHVTLLGGAFGRKSKCDFVNEAVILARETGIPIKVVWSREDDIRHNYLHSVAAQSLAAGLDADGKVTAWRHRVAYPTIFSTFDPSVNRATGMELGLGALNVPYAVDNLSVQAGEAEVMVRIGWLRSVCNIFQAFAVNVFSDELAYARGLDPLENYLDLLGPDRVLDFSAYGYQHPDGYPFDTARLRHVAERAAEMSGWGSAQPDGQALGLAVHYSFYSYIASVVRVAVEDDGSWSVPKVWTVIDCGLAVNPDRVES
ncbi:MAG: molybdopterin-dependent oxidoreductase, partial [Gammaproteobacteria bacterium]|nr:molybdopterin-dependent oxidoreductase [Gammaproteobacteria bacterium]